MHDMIYGKWHCNLLILFSDPLNLENRPYRHNSISKVIRNSKNFVLYMRQIGPSLIFERFLVLCEFYMSGTVALVNSNYVNLEKYIIRVLSRFISVNNLVHKSYFEFISTRSSPLRSVQQETTFPKDFLFRLVRKG